MASNPTDFPNYWFAERNKTTGKYKFITNCAYYDPTLPNDPVTIQNNVPVDPSGALDFFIPPAGFEDLAQYNPTQPTSAKHDDLLTKAWQQQDNTGKTTPKAATFFVDGSDIDLYWYSHLEGYFAGDDRTPATTPPYSSDLVVLTTPPDFFDPAKYGK